MLDLYLNIKKRREELGLTQSKLAEMSGYADKTMISKIEKGTIDLAQSKIVAIANALKTTPRELMGWDHEDANQIRLAPDESALLSDYNKLNSLGKEKARGDVSDLTQIPKYTSKIVPIRKEEVYLDAAHKRPGATPEDEANDDSIMDDEKF